MTLHPAPIPTARSQQIATGYLVLATVFWGCSFTWAKLIGDYANQQLGLPAQHGGGPIVILAFRFTLAGVIWFMIFPQARSGWSFVSLWRGLLLGGLMALGMILQMLGLDRTSAPVNAFLTALTVLFVPLISMLWYLRSPSLGMWVSVGLATVGIWLLTGATPTGFGIGEMLGVACAITFSFFLLAVNWLVPRDNPFRLNGMAMLVTGLVCCLLSVVLLHRSGRSMDWSLPVSFAVWPRLVLLIFLPTVAAFGILTYFQPRIDATRAALLYLCEPIFTAVYDYIETGHTLSAVAFGGAALIIVANVLVEVVQRWNRRPGAES